MAEKTDSGKNLQGHHVGPGSPRLTDPMFPTRGAARAWGLPSSKIPRPQTPGEMEPRVQPGPGAVGVVGRQMSLI